MPTVATGATLLLLTLVPHAALASLAAAIATVLAIYYALTSRGDPAATGCRLWPRFVAWVRSEVPRTFDWWMHGCRVHKAFEEPLDPEQKLIFCYVPHGMLPGGAGYVAHLPSWRRALPGIEPRTLTASIMHRVPMVRDLSAWLGFFSVSRRTFSHALETHGHVLLCPGGQREGLYADAAWRQDAPKVRLCGTHRGFVRMAVAHQAALVPLVSYGELMQLRSAAAWPWMQRLTCKWIGAWCC